MNGPAQNDRILPAAPERPDCCGGGCAVCVLDGYAEEVERWEAEVRALLATGDAASAVGKSQ